MVTRFLLRQQASGFGASPATSEKLRRDLGAQRSVFGRSHASCYCCALSICENASSKGRTQLGAMFLGLRFVAKGGGYLRSVLWGFRKSATSGVRFLDTTVIEAVVLAVRLAAHEVLKAVVGLDAVDVMDGRMRRQCTMRCFPYNAVLEWPPSLPLASLYLNVAIMGAAAGTNRKSLWHF